MSTATTGYDLADALRPQFPEAVVHADDWVAWLAPDSLAEVCAFLRDDPAHRYNLLNAITAVDYIEYFELIYQLTSIERNATATLKARCYGRGEVAVPSVTPVWNGAELQEREVYDLMGVSFTGHPKMKRIFLWEGFEGHPLRKDYLEPAAPYTWPHGG